MRTRIALSAALTALAVGCASTAMAQTPGDDYLESFSLNQPGSPLNSRQTLVAPPIDTTNFTVQQDVMSPPRSGGPPEPTTCGATTYGKTVWYDFYPHVHGHARIFVSGYDAVISVMEYNSENGIPNLDGRQCFNESTSTAEEAAIRNLRRGGFYTIQIGGVNNAAGSLELRFDFLADPDRDDVFSENDRCPTLAGPAPGGCPPRLRADSTIRALPTATGIEVLALSVRAPRRSRVAVSCSRGCRREVKRARSTVNFRNIRGSNLSAGSKIVIRVTRRRSIGTYIVYRIERGNFRKVERCLNPGSSRPRKRCG